MPTVECLQTTSVVCSICSDHVIVPFLGQDQRVCICDKCRNAVLKVRAGMERTPSNPSVIAVCDFLDREVSDRDVFSMNFQGVQIRHLPDSAVEKLAVYLGRLATH